MLGALEKRPDVVALTETWLKPTDGPFPIEGYQEPRHSHRNGRGGGVSLYVREGLTIGIETKHTGNYEALTLQLSSSAESLSVTVVYNPPEKNKLNFINEFVHYLTSLPNPGSKRIICGDMNIDLLKQTTIKTEYLSAMETIALELISPIESTRSTRRTESCIDHIFSSFACQESYTIDMGLSDHQGVFASFDCHIKKSKNDFHRPIKRILRDQHFKNTVNFVIQHELSKLNLSNILNAKEAFSKFYSTLQSLINRFFPIRRRASPPKARAKLPNHIIRQIKLKNLLYRAWIINRNTTLEDLYRRKRNEVSSLIRNFKKTCVDEQINTKGVFAVIKHFKDSAQPCLPFDSEDSVNELNDHFARTGSSLAERLPTIPFDSNIESVPRSMFFVTLSEEEILCSLEKLINKGANDSDMISGTLLAHLSHGIAPHLLVVLKKCLLQGYFPEEMKIAKVIPIHKNGNKTSPSNYRPISILPSLSKVFERVIFTRLRDYVEKFSILSKTQFGFRSKRSTVDAILDMVERIRDERDHGGVACSLFIDLQKAFDTVDHKFLLKKLDLYGIRGFIHDLLRSYLFNRKQFVLVNSIRSSIKQVNAGVPQGSILGPLLFILYINDINNACTYTNISVFADDTSLTAIAQNASQNLQNDLNNVHDWLNMNKLSLNINKTQSISFNSEMILDIKLNSEKIEQVNQVKYLGVFVDSHLNFKVHIEYVRKRICQLTGLLYRLRSQLRIPHLLLFYAAYIQPIIQYGILVYGCTSKSSLDVIYRAQKRIIRVIFRLHRYNSVTGYFEKHKILTVFQLHSYEIFKCLVKAKNGQHSVDLISNIFSRNSLSVSLRSSAAGFLRPVRYTSAYKKNSIERRLVSLNNFLTTNGLAHTLDGTSFNGTVHSFRDNFILGSNEVVNSVFK